MNVLTIAKPILKAVVGFVAPAAVLLTSAVLPSSPGGEVITGAEWITAACACVITAAAVWGVPNIPKPAADDTGPAETPSD